MSGEDARADLRERLVLAAVGHVAFDGWTEAAIEAGARELGLDAIEAQRLLPGGTAELFRTFSDWADARMAEAASVLAEEDLRYSERIQAIVMARFEALVPYREAVRRGVAFAAMPQNGNLGPGCFCRTVDRVWRAAGDRSADFSYYTKRALLAGVLASTTLVWLDDRSADGAITREFLARRIADVLRLGSLRAAADRLGGRLPDPFKLMARMGRRANYSDSTKP